MAALRATLPAVEAVPSSLPALQAAPVNPDGAFVQDKVLKSGWLFKRTRKTKGWKHRWFVLRADRLSCYKDQEEYKIHRQIYLADVTAVAALKDAKQPFSFGIFSKSKNFHFRAANEADTNDWTDKIWAAVANQVPEEDMMLSSPSTAAAVGSFRRRESMLMSSPPPESTPAKGARASMNTLDYSGPEVGSVSSFSDGARISQLSLSFQDTGFVTEDPRLSGEPQQITRNGTGLSSTEQLSKTVWHGFLYCLKSTGGIKQWKKYWIVVRNVNIGFYKNEEEYRAIKILPLENVVDAVEIDPLSRSRKHCLQVISQSKAYRFSAPDEETLVKALGAMKATLAKSKTPSSSAPLPQSAS